MPTESFDKEFTLGENAIDKLNQKYPDYIIGIDIAKPPWDKADFSCISMICKNCNTLIHSELFKGEQPTLETPKICPNCGIKFKYGITMKS